MGVGRRRRGAAAASRSNVTSMVDIVMGFSLVLAPLCAAGLNLAPPRRVALVLLMGVFAGVGANIGLAQQLRIGLGLMATGGLACAILAIGFERARWPGQGQGGGGSKQIGERTAGPQ